MKPCLPQELVELVEQMGIDPARLGTEQQACYDLPDLIEQATVVYDSTHLRLDIGVPQAALSKGQRGYVDPSLWDEGVPVAISYYQFSSRRSETGGNRNTFSNLSLRNGMNIGPWRLRNDANLSASTGQPTTFNSNQTYVQRDITTLKSQLTAGDVFSESALFDSVRWVRRTF